MCIRDRRRRHVEKIHRHVRELPAETLNGSWYERMEEAPDVANVEMASSRLVGLLGDANGLFALFDQRAGFGQKRLPRHGQSHAAPIALQQNHADLLFK